MNDNQRSIDVQGYVCPLGGLRFTGSFQNEIKNEAAGLNFNHFHLKFKSFAIKDKFIILIVSNLLQLNS